MISSRFKSGNHRAAAWRLWYNACYNAMEEAVMPGGKGPTISRKCDRCGSEYQASPRLLARGWDRCCSKSCANSLRARQQGKRRASDVPYQRQNSSSRFKEAARANAGYRCQCCGITQAEYGRGLDVHRIVPQDQGGEYIDGNVEVLCRSCHMKKDRAIGL